MSSHRISNRRGLVKRVFVLAAASLAASACVGSADLTAAAAPHAARVAGFANALSPANAAHRGQTPGSVKNLYVANLGNNTVTVYKPATTHPLANRTISTDINSPVYLTFDPANNLYVSNEATGKGWVSVYASGSTSPKCKIMTNIDDPKALAFDATNNELYVANESGDNITSYASCTYMSTISNGSGNTPEALATDGSGHLYAAWSNSTITEDKVKLTLSGIDKPEALTVDSAGNLWVANFSGKGSSINGSVMEFPPKSTTPSQTVISGIDHPIALAVDEFGTVYVENIGSDTVTEYTGGVLMNTIKGLDSPCCSIAIGSYNYLNVSNELGGSAHNGTVTEYAPGHTAPSRTITDGLSDPDFVAFGP